jgi:hypothetical protein
MSHAIRAISSWEELCQYVHESLCEKENLITEQFQTYPFPVFRNHKICAVEFHLQALRNVRLNAVWVLEKNEIYFYDARGERYTKLALQNWISIPQELQAPAEALAM